MKYLPLIFVTILIFSCSKENQEEVRSCIEVEYNQKFQAKMNDEICFPDGNSFVIKNIEDGFCPCDAYCFWEGELSVLTETTYTNKEKDLFRFGSTTYDLEPEIFPNTQIVSFQFDYEGGTLPDCASEYDSERVTLSLSVTK